MQEPSPRSAAAPHVVIVGSFNQDHVWRSARFPQPGETRLGRFSCGPGGKGFNQAIACVRQGVATAFVGALGRDALGDSALALAESEGLRARCERVEGEATGTAAILLDGAGQNMIVVGPGANLALSAAYIEAQRALIEGARVLVTQHEVALDATAAALRIARAAGVTTLHNPAPVLAEGADDLLALADLLTPNESEFAALLAARGFAVDANALASLADAELHALGRRLGVPTVVVTLGAAGVFVSHADGALRGDAASHYRHAAESVRVVDTTGAGDAFSGALAAALAMAPEAPFAQAVRSAGRVAGLAVETAGAALAIPRAEAVRARFG